MDGSTALAVLGLEPGATKQQIKITFRALVKGAHPDAFGVANDVLDATDAFVELRAAYERALVDAPNGTKAGEAAGSADTTRGLFSVAPSATRPVRSGAWFTSSQASARIDITDITDVAATGSGSLRAKMVMHAERAADPAEQAFASLLADELAAA